MAMWLRRRRKAYSSCNLLVAAVSICSVLVEAGSGSLQVLDGKVCVPECCEEGEEIGDEDNKCHIRATTTSTPVKGCPWDLGQTFYPECEGGVDPERREEGFRVGHRLITDNLGVFSLDGIEARGPVTTYFNTKNGIGELPSAFCVDSARKGRNQ